MNKEGYAVTCSKCNSTNIEYNYCKTMVSIKGNKTSTPVKCRNCNYTTTEVS